MKDAFELNCEKNNIKYKLFETDAFQFDLTNIKEKINVYLYDGAHTAEAQYKALEYYYPILADEFIFMVDDYNSNQGGWKSLVVDPTQKALVDLNLQVEHYVIKNPGDWWNGFYISLLKK